jgi:hypothetical protein
MTEAVVLLAARVVELPGRAVACVARGSESRHLHELAAWLLLPSALLFALVVRLRA